MNRSTRHAWNHIAQFRYHRNTARNHYTSLRDIQELENALPLVRQRIIDEARDAGWTWEEVGEALGIRADSARRRFGR